MIPLSNSAEYNLEKLLRFLKEVTKECLSGRCETAEELNRITDSETGPSY